MQPRGDVVGVVEVPATRCPPEQGGGVEASGVEHPQAGGQGRPRLAPEHCLGELEATRQRQRGDGPPPPGRGHQVGPDGEQRRQAAGPLRLGGLHRQGGEPGGGLLGVDDGAEHGQGLGGGPVGVAPLRAPAHHVGPALLRAAGEAHVERRAGGGG